MENKKVLMISTDRKLFDKNSSASKRISRYGEFCEELHIIVFSLNKYGFQEDSIAPNVFTYPTNSVSKWSYVKDAKRLGESLMQEGISVISTQDPFETGLVGNFLKKKFNIPLVSQIHTDLLSPYFSRGFLNKVRLRIAPKVLKNSDVVRVVSSKIKKDLIESYKIPDEKIVVLPIYTDVKVIEDAKPDQKFEKKFEKWGSIILMVSRLTPEKDIQTGIKAFSEVASKFKDTVLVIVGEGEEKENLEKMAINKAISDRVFFEGWVSDVSGIYQTADIFLNTSLFEGYGMSMVEAASADCAVVTTKVGVAYDFKPELACVVPVRDSEAVADCLEYLLGDKEKMVTMGKLLHTEIKKDSISFDEYLRRYANILNHAKG